MPMRQGKLGAIAGEEVPAIEKAGLALRRIQQQIRKLREAEEKAIETLNAVCKANGYGRKKYIFETTDEDTGKEIQLDCFIEKATVERARCRVHKEEKKDDPDDGGDEKEKNGGD